jgi:hypothetical protein
MPSAKPIHLASTSGFVKLIALLFPAVAFGSPSDGGPVEGVSQSAGAPWQATGIAAVKPTWPELWTGLADRTVLAGAKEKLPPGVYALVSEVVPGVGQVALHSYSLGDTGFVSSAGRYNPASAIKIIAAVGALRRMTLAGFSSSAVVDGLLDGERFRGPLTDLVQRALIYSDNEAYDWLQAVAGHDGLNGEVLGKPYRWPALAVRSRFSPKKTFGFFTNTPAFALSEGQRKGQLPALKGDPKVATCPNNCISLAGLQDVVRRVLLHHEIDAAHRFELPASDIAMLREFMHHAADRFSDGAAKVLGGPVHSYTRFGNVTGWFTGNGMVMRHKADPFEPGRGVAAHAPRYLITFAAPYTDDGHGPGTRDATPSLVSALLRAVWRLPRNGPPIQPDAGEIPLVQITRVTDGAVQVVVDAKPGDVLEAWLGRRPLPMRRTGTRWHAAMTLERPTFLVLRVLRDGWPIGHASRQLRLL